MAGSLRPEPLLRRVIVEMHLPEITIVHGMTERPVAAGHGCGRLDGHDRSDHIVVCGPARAFQDAPLREDSCRSSR